MKVWCGDGVPHRNLRKGLYGILRLEKGMETQQGHLCAEEVVYIFIPL